jgi:uncharacterized protein YgbK (DUF1537 family)
VSTLVFPTDLPPPWEIPDARSRIRAHRRAGGRRVAVLDDDPTGSQTVYDVSVVTELAAAQYAAALEPPGAVGFVLTNTRSLPEKAAVALTGDVGRALFSIAEQGGYPVDVVSRSDSTLRGHFFAEVRALDAARRSVTGRGFDGVLLAPGFFEAGRFTAGSVQWARVDGRVVPVGATEFAQDATFGYTASDLRDFVAEKSGGTVARDEIHAITLTDIRLGGPDRVAEILHQADDGSFVVVDGLEYVDYEVVVLGLLEAQGAGRSFLPRTGPSFVRALVGLEPRPPLATSDIWPTGVAGAHGLVVVGSHVGLTSLQVRRAQERGDLAEVELDVRTLLDPSAADRHLSAAVDQVREALRGHDVLLYTSRTLLRGRDPDTNLAIARTVSTAVTDVVRAALTARPAWVIAKGGITSHDVAVHGLGIRRAEVVGQLFPGLVSVLRPVEAFPDAVGVPLVVFAGNVGDENTLADVIARFSTAAAAPDLRHDQHSASKET